MTGNKVKLIASDVDGTLLPKGADAVPEENKALVLSWINSGARFAAISGRDTLSLGKLLAFAGDRAILVGCAGAVAVSGGRIVYSRPVPDAAVIKALKYSELEKKPLVLCGCEKIYVSYYGGADFISYVKSLYGDDSEVVKTTPEIRENIYKISFYSEIPDSGCDPSLPGVRTSYNANGWTEYVSALANKGAVLSGLQITSGVGKNSTAAAGNDVSDIPMLSKAAYAFAFDEKIAGCATLVRDFTDLKNRFPL